MNELEKRINDLIGVLAPSNKTGKVLSGVKKTLNSSSHIVDAVNNFSENLQDNLEDSVGGIAGTVGGWMAGKATKLVGGIAGGIVAGTLKTVAGIIPDSQDLKLPETDKKIAHCINTFSLPLDKTELFELLQFSWGTITSNASPYGRQALDSFIALNSRVYSALQIAADQDQGLLNLAKSYTPKKRFGLFKTH